MIHWIHQASSTRTIFLFLLDCFKCMFVASWYGSFQFISDILPTNDAAGMAFENAWKTNQWRHPTIAIGRSHTYWWIVEIVSQHPTHYIVARKRLNIIKKILYKTVSSNAGEDWKKNKNKINSFPIANWFDHVSVLFLPFFSFWMRFKSITSFTMQHLKRIEFHFFSKSKKMRCEWSTAMEMCDCLQAFHAQWYYTLYLWICNFWIHLTFIGI